jgi:16S rRNA (guanine966-N2)-methyltransferase
MMKKPKRTSTTVPEAADLRIIGGRLRGRKLCYHGDRVTRPMKHRVRESIFNLVSEGSRDRQAIDLFAGTGALGLEALSRGARGAIFIEKHVPTARVLQENVDTLGVADQSAVLVTSAFLWGRRDLPRAGEPPPASPSLGEGLVGAVPPTDVAWLVFCSPPYAFYVERWEEMERLLGEVMGAMPADSLLVVEADERFDFALLPQVEGGAEGGAEWDIRTYAPAVVGVWHKR